MPIIIKPEYWGMKEIQARIDNCSEKRVKKLMSTAALPVSKPGGTFLMTEKNYQEWANNQYPPCNTSKPCLIPPILPTKAHL